MIRFKNGQPPLYIGDIDKGKKRAGLLFKNKNISC